MKKLWASFRALKLVKEHSAWRFFEFCLNSVIFKLISNYFSQTNSNSMQKVLQTKKDLFQILHNPPPPTINWRISISIILCPLIKQSHTFFFLPNANKLKSTYLHKVRLCPWNTFSYFHYFIKSLSNFYSKLYKQSTKSREMPHKLIGGTKHISVFILINW